MKKLSREIWIVAAKRTPFGALSGGLKDVSAIDLISDCFPGIFIDARVIRHFEFDCSATTPGGA